MHRSANTLLRVTMTVGTDGRIHYQGGEKKANNLRGTKVRGSLRGHCARHAHLGVCVAVLAAQAPGRETDAAAHHARR